MQGMRESRHESALWAVPDAVPGMLHAPGAFDTPQQAARGSDAGSDRQVQGCTWPGRDFGIRAPLPGETAISWAEVHHAMKVGLL